MTIVTYTYRLPHGWTGETQFLTLGSYEDIPARAWRMRRLYRLVRDRWDTLYLILRECGDSPRHVVDSLERLIGRGLVEEVRA